MENKLAILVSIFFFTLIFSGCLDPSTKGTLELEILSPPYPRPRCAKGSISLGKLYPRGEPVSQAQITLNPGAFLGSTDDQGKVVLSNVPEGTYTIQVDGPGFQSKSQEITILSGQHKTVSITIRPCMIVTSGDDGYLHHVGYGSQKALLVVNLCGTSWEGATYTWDQLEGPDIRDSVSSWTGPRFFFTTRPLTDLKTLPDTPRMLSISHDEAGEYVFQVTGTNNQGITAKAYAYVTSANVSTGINTGVPGESYYFIGNKQGPWKWFMDELGTQWPAGWPVNLKNKEDQIPNVRPEVPFGESLSNLRQISFMEDVSISTAQQRFQISFAILIGLWDGAPRDCGRSECHIALQSSWEKTKHGITWRRLLDGEAQLERGQPAESCATCHSLGYDRNANNGGYDDVVDHMQISFPAELKKDNYQNLPQEVKNVSNVHCNACHGPARVTPVKQYQIGRFDVGVCATCHDRQPEQDLVAQWKTSRMSQTVQDDYANGPDTKAQCKSCHDGEEFYYTFVRLGRRPTENTVAQNCCEYRVPITCQTCHSPMFANNKAQVHRYGAIETSSGLKLDNVGSTALCAICHNTEHDVSQPTTLANRLAPHSPQVDLSYGHAGYLLGPNNFPELTGIACSQNAGEGCVTCHMDKGPVDPTEAGYREVGDHTFRMTSLSGVQNTRPCQACHSELQSFNPRAKADYDGNGQIQGVDEELEGLLALISRELSTAIEERHYWKCGELFRQGVGFKSGDQAKIVVVDSQGFDLGDCNRNGLIDRAEDPFIFPDADVLLHKAAYNYLLIVKDKSRGLHNYPYAIKLLQRTLYALREQAGNIASLNWKLYQ